MIGWERSGSPITCSGCPPAAVGGDGRATDVVLTAEGSRQFRAAVPVHAAWVRDTVFSDTDRGQEAALADALAAVHDSLLQRGTLPPPEFGPPDLFGPAVDERRPS